MRILALIPGGISDQLLFFPALEAIKKAYPKAEIGVVAEPSAIAAYRVSKIVNTVIPFAFSANNNSPSDWANLLGIIRDREYEVAITTHLKWNQGLLLWLSGVPTRVAYSSTTAPWFYTATVPEPPASTYLADSYRKLLSAIGIEPSPSAPTIQPNINVPEADISWANALRDRLNLKNGYVLMYPGPATDQSPSAEKATYPIQSWQTLISDFRAKQPELPVVLLQTEESVAQVSALKSSDSGLLIATANNLGQSAAMVAGADLLLTPDSPIMQLAIALKVFTLGLFGTQSPEAMLPLAQGEETRFIGIPSPTNSVADIAPETILKKVWGGS
ncbi:MAG: glycosyltransferase [Phormidesmis priestleyi]|uniref:Glycosyltransferase n=1 Tax=Phormidesmis priestleyi TaxID=268141 RepID=A0A2W4ZHZ4_9CYAN|nr:MAG: glycosyltransferase [Phormidesmis priestleyi]